MSDADKYPEHAKMAAVMEESQIIGYFLENSPYTLAEYRQFAEFDEPVLTPVVMSTERILAAYFQIDLDKIEAEKRQMLDEIRAANG